MRVGVVVVSWKTKPVIEKLPIKLPPEKLPHVQHSVIEFVGGPARSADTDNEGAGKMCAEQEQADLLGNARRSIWTR